MMRGKAHVVQVLVNTLHRSDLINMADLSDHHKVDQTWIVAQLGLIHAKHEDPGHRLQPTNRACEDLQTVHHSLNNAQTLSLVAMVPTRTHYLSTQCLCGPV